MDKSKLLTNENAVQDPDDLNKPLCDQIQKALSNNDYHQLTLLGNLHNPNSDVDPNIRILQETLALIKNISDASLMQSFFTATWQGAISQINKALTSNRTQDACALAAILAAMKNMQIAQSPSAQPGFSIPESIDTEKMPPFTNSEKSDTNQHVTSQHKNTARRKSAPKNKPSFKEFPALPGLTKKLEFLKPNNVNEDLINDFAGIVRTMAERDKLYIPHLYELINTQLHRGNRMVACRPLYDCLMTILKESSENPNIPICTQLASTYVDMMASYWEETPESDETGNTLLGYDFLRTQIRLKESDSDTGEWDGHRSHLNSALEIVFTTKKDTVPNETYINLCRNEGQFNPFMMQRLAHYMSQRRTLEQIENEAVNLYGQMDGRICRHVIVSDVDAHSNSYADLVKPLGTRPALRIQYGSCPQPSWINSKENKKKRFSAERAQEVKSGIFQTLNYVNPPEEVIDIALAREIPVERFIIRK